MSDTGWLIVATFVGPVVGTLVGIGIYRSVISLTKARAQQVEQVDASGADLFHHGVPLTEAQFREAWAAKESALDKLGPPAERDEWQRKLAGEAINRISLLAGTFPNAFPSFGDVDEAWSWYSTSNYYVTRDLPRRHGMPVRRWRPAELAAEQLGADDAG
jgi:hypothetical protein